MKRLQKPGAHLYTVPKLGTLTLQKRQIAGVDVKVVVKKKSRIL